MEIAEEQCDFLSKEFSNSSAFSWAYTICRALADWDYRNPAGPTIVDHRVFLVRLLVAGLPLAGAYASGRWRLSARHARELAGSGGGGASALVDWTHVSGSSTIGSGIIKVVSR